MNFQLEKHIKKPTDSELIADLARVAKQNRLRSVSMMQYVRHGNYSLYRFSTRFGNWLYALQLTGLEVARHYRVNGGTDLFRNLRKVWTVLGRQPRYTEMKKPFSQFTGRTYEWVFGSWRKALEWFVKLANDPELQKKDAELPARVKKQFKSIREIGRGVSLCLRFQVLRRDNYTCKACGKSPATHKGVILHIDHVKPLAKGEKTIMKNLQTLCGDCNVGKGISS